MAKSLISLHVERSGPLFDGEAQAAVREWLIASKQELAETGADWIRIAAFSFDKSGRGGTGKAAEDVHVTRFGDAGDYRIWGGMRRGTDWWPWLEGISKRNLKSRFKGYHTFRLTRLRLRRYVGPVLEKRLQDFIGRMGGRVT